MKKILFFFIGLALHFAALSQAEIKQQGDTVKIVKRGGGIAYFDVAGYFRSNNPGTGSSNDSIVTWDPVSKLFKKISRTSLLTHTHPQFQVIDLNDSLTALQNRIQTKLSIADAASTYTTISRTLDSLSAVQGRINAKLSISDAATTYITITRTLDSLAQLQARIQTKQPLLGYTAENAANKATDFSTLNDVLYPTVAAVNAAINTAVGLYVPLTQKGANNGVAPLDAGGKIAFDYLPATLMIYKGTWNPNTNSPTLTDGSGTSGWVYEVTWSGGIDSSIINLGSGNITFYRGDHVIYNGSTWQRSVGTNRVNSVNGQQGVVTLTTANISESGNLYYTDGRVQTYGDGRYPQLAGSYGNPAWITSLAWSKITGAPSFLTTETDPTIYAWAKASTKPSYTYSEVGAYQSGSTVANSTQWNGNTMTGASSGGDSYIMTSPDAAAWKYSNMTQVKAMLGLGSNAYTSTAYLPLTGGTLTGTLSGTSGDFSGAFAASYFDTKTGTGYRVFSSSTLRGGLGTGTWAFGDGTQDIAILSNTSLKLGAGGFNTVTLLGNGNTGVGTTSPNDKLEVVGNIRINNAALRLLTSVGTARTMLSESTQEDWLRVGLGFNAVVMPAYTLFNTTVSDGTSVGQFAGKVKVTQSTAATAIETVISGGGYHLLQTNSVNSQQWGWYIDGSDYALRNVTGSSNALTVSASTNAIAFNNSVTASSFSASSSGNIYGLSVSRGTTSHYGGVSYRTAGSEKWFGGMRETGDENFRLFSSALGLDVMVLNHSTGAASFLNDVSALNFTAGNNYYIRYNGYSLLGRNAADNAYIDIVKVNSSNEISIASGGNATVFGSTIKSNRHYFYSTSNYIDFDSELGWYLSGYGYVKSAALYDANQDLLTSSNVTFNQVTATILGSVGTDYAATGGVFSGTQRVIRLNIGGTYYYFTAYPSYSPPQP